MLDKEKWEYSKEEAKDLAQDYLDKKETRASCIKYFESHFKISTATANRWYNRIYDELVIPDISSALDIKSYKDTVEIEINKCIKKIKKINGYIIIKKDLNKCLDIYNSNVLY